MQMWYPNQQQRVDRQAARLSMHTYSQNFANPLKIIEPPRTHFRQAIRLACVKVAGPKKLQVWYLLGNVERMRE